MRRHRCWGGVGLSLLWLSGSTAWAAPESARLHVDAEKLLAPSQDNADTLRAEQRELERALEAAREPVDQATARLAMANWLLARQPARPATRWLLGMATPTDLQTIAQAASQAQRHLQEAGRLLKELGAGSAENADRSRTRRLSSNAEILKGFADVMSALPSAGEKARPEDWAERALGLSEARESENIQVAAAATLWQAVAWDQAGRRERAMSTLPDALARPDQSFDYLARLLRCRLLADTGQHAAAMALVQRIMVAGKAWFPRERPAGIAARKRLAALLQLRIGQEWSRQLKTTTQPANAEKLDAMLARLASDSFPEGEDEPEVYVLETTLPLIVKPPATAVPAPEDAPREAPSGRSAPPSTAPAEGVPAEQAATAPASR